MASHFRRGGEPRPWRGLAADQQLCPQIVETALTQARPQFDVQHVGACMQMAVTHGSQPLARAAPEVHGSCAQIVAHVPPMQLPEQHSPPPPHGEPPGLHMLPGPHTLPLHCMEQH